MIVHMPTLQEKIDDIQQELQQVETALQSAVTVDEVNRCTAHRASLIRSLQWHTVRANRKIESLDVSVEDAVTSAEGS